MDQEVLQRWSQRQAYPLGCDLSSPLASPNSNAISKCFIALSFLIIATVTAIPGYYQLFKYTRVYKTYGELISKSTNQILKISLIILQLVIIIATFTKYALTTNIQLLKLAYFATPIHIISLIIPLHLIETSKSHIPNATVLFYWIFQFVLMFIITIQQFLASTEHKILPNSITSITLLILSLVNIATIFFMEYFRYKPNTELINENDSFILSSPDVISRLTFSYMNPMLQTAYDNSKLDEKDLPLPPPIITTAYSAPILEQNWNSQTFLKHPSLVKALAKTFGFGVFCSLLYDLIETIVSFIQPLLLRRLIMFFKTEDHENILIVKGLTIAFLMFLSNILSTSFYNQYMILTVEVAQGCKSALMHLVFNKAMRLSQNERNNRSTGDIINHMSVDISRIQSLTSYVQTMVSAPTRLVLCLWSLYWLLGKSTFAGIITMAILIPLNTLLVKSLRSYHKQQMKLKDKRTSFVSEILQNIKSIKLYAWEDPMLEKLRSLRDDQELKNLNKIGTLSAGINFAWTCVPFFVSCSTFAAFAYVSDIPLSPEIVFPALSLFDLLSDPIFAIPSLITALIECNVSINRIVNFLLADEIDLSIVERLPPVKVIGETSVVVSNATFLWNKIINSYHDEESEFEPASHAVALKDINFTAKKGELSCILGKVGSGKSTFLKCLLGELTTISADPEVKPSIQISGSVAYCSQIPWIINASFKDNILFGHRYDEAFYKETIRVCQLLPDLEILPDHDETLVGEKGISLSGGQKARLSLARAIYTRADVYLFDDVLSAVDAHVGQNIIDQVLGKNGVLKTKTKILCTNSIKVLNQAANVSLLKDSKIFETGSVTEIMSNPQSEIYRLIQEYGSQNNEDEDTETNEQIDDDDVVNDESNDVNLIEGEYEGVGSLGVNLDESTGEELLRFSNKPADDDEMNTLKAASIATFRAFEQSSVNDRKMQQSEEKKVVGRVKWEIFRDYAKACSYFGIFITLTLVVVTVATSIASNYWLMFWSEHNIKEGSNTDVLMYVGIYALLGIGSGLFTLIRAMCLWTLCSIPASKKLHGDMARAVVHTPLEFFETTPMGRIINRFSQDMRTVDNALPRVFSALFSSSIKTLFTMFIIGYNMPPFVIVIIALSFVYNYYQKYYVVTIRDLKRIVSISKSPIFALIQESLNGCETIRAYDQLKRFSFLNSSNIDQNLISAYCSKSTNRWLSTRLQFIGSLITLSTSLLAIGSLYSKHKMSSGLIGLVMSYAIRVTSSMNFIVRKSVEIESDVICCERIFEYCRLEPEKSEIKYNEDEESIIVPTGWPANGNIEFKNYSTRYRKNLDPVLNNISFSVKNGEKIGIVGRTGAGKSTLVLSLFRLIDPFQGYIGIDGINTNLIQLNELRKNLSIIPQDAQCIEGSIRYNLDPINQYDDEQIWNAIRMSHLDEHVNKMSIEQNLIDDPLSCLISESGNNLSVGQRQLICLARILLKTQKSKDVKLQPTKILILDEATSSIDTETDNLIQQTIRDECNDLTILTIAHRLNTIMDNDRILVLDKGGIIEFDTPSKLLQDKDSVFYSMCADGGYINGNGNNNGNNNGNSMRT